MSNLRTLIESRDAGEPSYQDHDRDHHVQTDQEASGEETTVETSSAAAKESGALPGSPSLDSPRRPRSVALAEVAANAVHAAWETGYLAGFSAGRLEGFDKAAAIVDPNWKPTHPDDGNPF